MNVYVKASGHEEMDDSTGEFIVDNRPFWGGTIRVGLREFYGGHSSRVFMTTTEARNLARKLRKAARKIERRNENGEA